MAALKTRAPASGWSSPAASPNVIATSCARRFPRSTRCSARAKCRRSSRRSERGSRVREVAPESKTVSPRGRQRSATPLTFYTKAPTRVGPRAHGLRTSDRSQPPDYIYDADTPALLTTPRHFAYVKIAEGCDYTCAFCIIPTLRGEYRSRTIDSIVREAHALAARGVRELLLISQDTSFYGIDRGERGALARLLRELNKVEGLELDPPALPLPDDDHRRCPGGDGGVREGVPLRRPAAAARVRRRAEAHAPSGQSRDLRQAALADPRPRSRRHTSNDLHRRLPGRDRDGVRRTEAFVADTGFDTSASSPTRTRKARGRSRWPTTCRRDEAEAARWDHEAAAGIVAAASRGGGARKSM